MYDALYPSNMQTPIYLTLNAARSLRDVTDLRTTEELIKSFTGKNSLFPSTVHEAVFDIHCIFHYQGFWIFLIHSHVLFSCCSIFLLCHVSCPRIVRPGFLDISSLHLMQSTAHCTHQVWRQQEATP